MTNRSIEFHDSTLYSIQKIGDTIEILLKPAYVHESSGRPGVDKGIGCSQDVMIVLSESNLPTLTNVFPVDISEGEIKSNEIHIRNMLPIPFDLTENFTLKLELTDGSNLVFSGTKINVKTLGDATFIENFNPRVAS